MYPVSYEADFKAQPDRVTTFFRIILAIPWLIVAYVYLILSAFTHFFAWVAVVILGRYPEWLYNFNAGVVRFLDPHLRLDVPADRRLAAVRHRRRPRLPGAGQHRPAGRAARAGSRRSSGSS